MTQTDRQFMEMAVTEAAKSRTEQGKVAPKVGTVVARGGEVIAAASG